MIPISKEQLVKEILADDLPEKLAQVMADFHGSADDLIEAVGMVIVGRLYGWKVVRLVSSNRRWQVASRLFGDPKLLMKEEGTLVGKASGYLMVRRLGGFWDFISGKVSRDDVPLKERKMVSRL